LPGQKIAATHNGSARCTGLGVILTLSKFQYFSEQLRHFLLEEQM
jgi:hypothetical protein